MYNRMVFLHKVACCYIIYSSSGFGCALHWIAFLASDQEKLLRTLTSGFVKEDVISSAKTFNELAKIDVTADANRKLGKEVDIGIVTRREINELKQSGKITPREKMNSEHSLLSLLSNYR